MWVLSPHASDAYIWNQCEPTSSMMALIQRRCRRGANLQRSARSPAVATRSVAMSSTAPRRDVWFSMRANLPSRASQAKERK